MTAQEAKGRRVGLFASALVVTANLLFLLPALLGPSSFSGRIQSRYGMFQLLLSIGFALFLFLGHRWARWAMLISQIPTLPILFVSALLTLSYLFSSLASGWSTTSGSVEHLARLESVRSAVFLVAALTLYVMAAIILVRSLSLEAFMAHNERYRALSRLRSDNGV